MEPNTLAPDPRSAPSPSFSTASSQRSPWVALATMALATFVVVSGEMMPTAVLPALAADLEVSQARAGLLVSAWAMTVVVASFPLVRLTARVDRPLVISAALTVFALATLVTAAAPDYTVAMASRLVAAAATGLLWASVNAHAVAIVREDRMARATAIAMFGGTLGTVAAVPAGNAIAEAVGWRLPFAVLGVIALVAAVAVPLVLRRAPVVSPDAPARDATVSRRSLWPVAVIGLLGTLVMVAHFMPLTFVAETFTVSSVPSPVLLAAFGLVGAVGVAIVGTVGDRRPALVAVAVAAAVAASLAALLILGRHGVLDVAIVVAWGLAAGAIGPALQANLMRTAGPENRPLAGTLMPVTMNLGIALGAAAGSGVVDRWSIGALPMLALIPALLATGGFALAQRRIRTPGPQLAPAAAAR